MTGSALALAGAAAFALAAPALAADPATVTMWGGPGSGTSQFAFAHHLAVNSAGEVYVGELLNNHVQRFSAAGAFLGAWAVPDADGVAIAPDGSGYVVRTSSIGHYSTTGALLGSWGSAGSFVQRWGGSGPGAAATKATP